MRIFRAFVLAIFALLVPVFFRHVTQGFRLGKLDLRHSVELLREPLSDEVVKILGQQFYYLDRGVESYVFTSEDGKWVLKLFRADPVDFFFRKLARRIRGRNDKLSFRARRADFIQSCKLAFGFAKEETALLYLHLGFSKSALSTITVRAPHRSYQIDLNRYSFAIQKRARPMKAAFLEIYRERNIERGREYLRFLKELIERKEKLGIRSCDPAFTRNLGFLEDRAIEMDFGSYKKVAGESINAFSLKLKGWFNKEMPEWVFLVDEIFSCSSTPF